MAMRLRLVNHLPNVGRLDSPGAYQTVDSPVGISVNLVSEPFKFKRPFEND